MGTQAQGRADYLDQCRTRRNTADYDQAGAIPEAEVAELLAEVTAFRQEVLTWLRANHSALTSAS